MLTITAGVLLPWLALGGPAKTLHSSGNASTAGSFPRAWLPLVDTAFTSLGPGASLHGRVPFPADNP